MSRISILIHLFEKFKCLTYSSHHDLSSSSKTVWRRRREFNPRWSFRTHVFGTGDFSNSSTPPSLKIGAPPRTRTAHAEVAARPLATCCCGAWHPKGDSNTQRRVWNPLASPSATGAELWCARLDSNQHCTAFETAASAVGLRAHW